ncbi:MAG: FAD-binding protein [Acidobacteria bacterium]|nr:FAD-binding protein [Acidobacteriota bacterium]
MTPVSIEYGRAVPQANASLVDAAALRRELESQLEGEVRFDKISRALYSTDASVYQIEPLGVVVAKSREDVVRAVQICARFRCPLTVRGGGTSQAGQAIGPGLQIDTSKYFNRLLEVNPAEHWARVEPGLVLDELNAQLLRYGLRFAPDISTASRATVGGMMANNSSGTHSVIYGKTIDHVLEQNVVLADGTLCHLRCLSPQEVEHVAAGDTLEAAGTRVVRELAAAHADEIDRRFPKILRRVGGYNLDAFVRPKRRFNLCDLMVGSEGTLGVMVEAKIRLIPLPKAKAILSIEFAHLLEALAATPAILEHHPAAVEVMDKFILDHTRGKPAFERLRDFLQGDPGALLVVEFFGERTEDLPPRLEALERDLTARGWGYHFHRTTDPAAQARIWKLRESALGLSMAMKGDAKSLSFVEDTAVAPEKLRDYIERFLAMVRRHNTTAGVYAHASVGCLHVRPVVNLKTEEGVRRFEAIARDSADLVLEYGGALSGEHGDGLVRSPLMRKMFGPALYEAFRTIKRTFDPLGILNPGKIVDAPPQAANLRYGSAYHTPDPPTFFDFSEYGGLVRAVEMCSGLGACRKKLEGTMCPSYMATKEETHSTRGRANVLRLAMTGQLGETNVTDHELLRVLDLCLECHACKAECPVGVDMARYKSEFLAGYWARNGVTWRARLFGNIHKLSRWGSRLAPVSNWIVRSRPARRLNEMMFGIDRRRTPPPWRRQTLRRWFARRPRPSPEAAPTAVLFTDTFTNYYEPEIGIAAVELLELGGLGVQPGENQCCGRPLISQGLLEAARQQARVNTRLLYPLAAQGQKIIFCEPSCLSAMREEAPALLRGEEQSQAQRVARSCLLFEEFLEQAIQAGQVNLALKPGPEKILLHGHCHQKAMGLVPAARALLSRIPGCTVEELDAGCCGMAGSFGLLREHYEISQNIGERRLLPAARNQEANTVLVAAGTSCRHQVEHFTRREAVHPAVLLHSLLGNPL